MSPHANAKARRPQAPTIGLALASTVAAAVHTTLSPCLLRIVLQCH